MRYIKFLVWREWNYWKLVRSARRKRKLNINHTHSIIWTRPRTEYEEFSFKLTFKEDE